MIWRHVHVLLISQYWLLRVNIHSKSLESLGHRAPWLLIASYFNGLHLFICHILSLLLTIIVNYDHYTSLPKHAPYPPVFYGTLGPGKMVFLILHFCCNFHFYTSKCNSYCYIIISLIFHVWIGNQMVEWCLKPDHTT